MDRRTFIGLTLASASSAVLPFARSASAQELKEIRIGWQKAGIFPAVRQRRILEDVFKPRGIDVKWVEFPFGPPMMEALNTGNIDYGYVGDSPPIFAQAASANLIYVAAIPSSGRNEALIVAETIAANSGIGYMAMHAREFMLVDVVVLAIVIYALLGKLADSSVRLLERQTLGWHPAFHKR